MLSDKSLGMGQELRISRPSTAVISSMEVSDVQQDSDQRVEDVQAFLLNREAMIEIRCIATLHLYADLRLLRRACLVAWIRKDAVQIIPFIPPVAPCR
ncbi:MAG: hypothetical protein RLZZ216_1433 [Cyanobacteriota bacterium]